MQTPLYELIPWWGALGTLVCAGVAAFSLSRLRHPNPLSRYLAGRAFAGGAFTTVFLLCLTVESAVKSYQRLHDLAQIVTPYPGAMPQFVFFKSDPGTWMLVTSDSFEKVRAFYSRLANGEKVPFRHIRDSDTHFVFGQGTNAVALDIDDSTGDGGDTIIDYRVPAGPQAF